MAKASTTIVRILCGVIVDGAKYQPDQLVEFAQDKAKALHKSGEADPHPDAVAYIKGKGGKVIKHAAPEADTDGDKGSEGGTGGGSTDGDDAGAGTQSNDGSK